LSRPLTIAHILSSFELGGQERMALDLATGQRALGCNVLAVSLASNPGGVLVTDFETAGVRVVTMPKRSGFDFTMPFRLAGLLRDAQVDIVHTHNPQPLIYGAPAARLVRVGLVHTKHGANPDGGHRLWMRRAAGSLVDALVAVSRATAAVAERNREVDSRKLSVISNGIDVSLFHPDEAARAEGRRQLGIPPDAWVMGTVGRLAPEKDYSLLIRAAAPLLCENVRLVLVGDGEEASALRALAATVPGGQFVHFSGVRRDVARLLAAMDVFVLSSRTEGLPLVLPEAMATGLPVVSTAVGGIPEVIEEGVTGFLVPPGNEEGLRERLVALARDRALAHSCGERARRVASAHYSRERMIGDYMEIYSRVRARRGKTSARASSPPAGTLEIPAAGLSEEEMFLDGDQPLFVSHHRAAGHEFVVIVPPLFEEQARTRKVLVNLARDLARNRVNAVRFDYGSTGLSGGAYHEFTIERAFASLDRVIAYCQGQGAQRIHLVGFRFGGFLALSLRRDAPVSRRIVWEPILNLSAYLQEMLRIEVSNQMFTFGEVRATREDLLRLLRGGQSILIDGYRVSPTVAREIEASAAIDVQGLAPLKGKTTFVFWDNKKLHATVTAADLTSLWVAGVRFSWKNIRTLEPRNNDLLGQTVRAVTAP
jgi:glycosyltransferase involved in cell wall biosynthesis/pimeloyl-ACP methyl ester carboxylesterase